ncbi:MAG: hypothetical protein Q4G13_07995 [Moraxella sp.]|nr:hypothetical protein [Moraxella sp.]
MKKLLTLTATIAILTGCASTGNITPQYINPANYQAYDCQSLQSEIQRISSTAEQTEKRNVGLSATGMGIGIAGGRHGIYPTVSFGVGSGSGQRQAKQGELSRLYGEHDAMVVAARQKGCNFAQGIKIYGE